ncbi:MAG: hypothetical protein ABI995_05125 [Acidobacteriota bacterium]
MHRGRVEPLDGCGGKEVTFPAPECPHIHLEKLAVVAQRYGHTTGWEQK